MADVRREALPENALLRTYTRAGDYTDCYVTEVPRAVTHAEFVEAFYRTPLFRCERWILAQLVNKPSTDDDVRALAHGRSETFAAWNVEARAPDQLLLCDFRASTRSWLMVAATANATRLYFGSAVVGLPDPRTGEKRMSLAFGALLGFHKLYSRALLASARRALERAR